MLDVKKKLTLRKKLFSYLTHLIQNVLERQGYPLLPASCADQCRHEQVSLHDHFQGDFSVLSGPIQMKKMPVPDLI